MRIDPKGLVRRLTPTATRNLEAAVARAASGQLYEVVPELLLAALLAHEDGDAEHLLARCGENRLAVLSRAERAIATLRAGSGGRPVFSQALFSWLRDTWLVASVERGALVVSSADLLATFAEDGARYSAESFPELERLPHAELRKRVLELVRESTEEHERRFEDTKATANEGNSTRPSDGALAKFTVSFTQQARAGTLDPVIGRHREIRQVIDILSRRRKNNPILVGEPGVGKTALIEGLARAIVADEVPPSLRGVEVVGLDLGALQAGAGVRGEFEQRLKGVIQEIKASPTPIILFIDEAHTLIGAGGAQGTADAANLLKPELARGELRTVAATTWSEFKKYFEKDAALERRFQPVKIEEPSEDEAIAILRGLKDTYEAAHGVIIRDSALVAAAKLSHRYVSGRQLPDKAVDLLDTASARVKTEARAKPEALLALEAKLTAKQRALASLQRDAADGVGKVDALPELEREIAALMDELRALEGRWEQERSVAARLVRARAEAEKAPGAQSARELVEAKRALHELQARSSLVRVDVDEEAVANVVQSWTGIPVGQLQADSLHTILNLEARLGARIRGQDHVVRTVAESVRMASAGLANPEAPRAVMLFVGTSGVGKTETARALADLMFGGEAFLTSIAMSEFTERHSVSRLIGSPPGYVGYGEGGVLTEAVRRRPYSVVLLDECEKADLQVMNLFYQVFDKGTLSDGEGRRIDFRNTIVVLTSNLATELIASMHEGGKQPTTDEIVHTIRPALSRHFKPALLARMTVVPFAPISEEILREITQLKLQQLVERTRTAHGAQLSFAPDLPGALAERCLSGEAGARAIEHILRDSLVPELSRELLKAMAEGRSFRKAQVGLAAETGFTVTVD